MGILSSIGAAFLKIKGAVMATTATKVVTAVVTTTVVVGATIGVAQTDVLASPETKVEHAMESLLENEEGAVSEVFGWKEFVKSMSKKGLETGFGFQLEDVPLDELGLSSISLPNIGMDFVYKFDTKDKKMSLTAGAKVADATLLSAELYADEEQVLAAAPELFEGYMGANYANTEFSEKLKNSELSTMLGEDVVAMIESLTTQMQETAETEDVKRILGYVDSIQENMDLLWKNMEAERAEDAELTVDGETVKCKVYTASFDKEDLYNFLSAMIDDVTELMTTELQESVKELEETDPELYAEVMTQFEDEKAVFLADAEAVKEQIKNEEVTLNLTIYMKGKRLLKAELDFAIEESFAKLIALFGKEGNRYDNMSLTLDYTEAGETVQLFALTHVTENTKELLSSEWNLTVEGEELGSFVFTYEKIAGDFYLGLIMPSEEMAFELEGVLTIPNKGKELAFELSDISYTEYGEKISLGFKSDIYLKVLDGDITAPAELKWDVVSMSADDWEDLMSEMTGNAYSLVMRLMFSN